MIGKRLAHYDITSQLGKGGMGEVYQAKDQKLGREVAIKVLPEEFARDTDRVARFQREAKLLASLNHPNIAAIHGLEEADGTHFLVLELIEGETLSERLKRGPIPVEEALKLALQIAEALEAAHEKGVIHRDLKPANIKVTPDGKVKVLDFGLAKAYAGAPEDMDLSNSPTLSDAATKQGVILGTAAYMSPEQARGENVDKRADIWAFGVVLFEMLTGRQVFTGKTVSDTLASVLAREPEWKSLPPNLHSRILFLLERCLKKDPKNRYSGISDARIEIQEVLNDPRGVSSQSIQIGESRTKLRTELPWMAAALVLGAIVAGAVIWNLRAPEPRQVMRFSYGLPEVLQSSDLLGLAISPDGKKLVYATDKGFYSRSVDEMEARLIAKTDDRPSFLCISPNGQWIGYESQSDRKMKKIAVTGGAPVILCDTGLRVLGASWSRDETIVYSQLPDGVMRVSANGGTPEPLMKVDLASIQEGGFPAFPRILPDGKTLLYTSVIQLSPLKAKIMLQSLASGEHRELFEGINAEYISTGHLVYGLGAADDADLFAVPFNLDALEVTGSPVSLIEGITERRVSQSGTLAYISRAAAATEAGSNTESTSAAGPERTLWWVDRSGREERIQAPSRGYAYPKISPDGKKIALTATVKANTDIWILDLVRGTLPRLTFHEGADYQPVWTPDGQQIAYSCMGQDAILRGGISGIFWKAADGTGESEFLASTPGKFLFPYSWTEDGKILIAGDIGLDVQTFDVGMLSMEEDRSYTPLLKEDYRETQPQLSPDGRWLAYSSDESGEGQVYVRPFPDVAKGGRWQVSTNGGNSPRWSPDGSELYYLIGGEIAEAVMAVEVETEPTFNPGKPKVLFRGNYLGTLPSNGTPYDIHPDGKRFLMMKEFSTTAEESTTEKAANVESKTAEPLKINIVVNWFEELKSRVPVP